MKKLIYVLPLFALAFVLTLSPAFAKIENNVECPFPLPDHCQYHCRHIDKCCPKIDVSNNNSAGVTNNVKAWSNTGKNTAGGYNYWYVGGSINTGHAYASANVDNQVGLNTTKISMPIRGTISVSSSNSAQVHNDVKAGANTGKNSISYGGAIATGNATSGAGAFNFIGSNVTEIP